MGRKIKDLTGQRYGILTVVSMAGHQGDAITWNCLCDCGKTSVVQGKNLQSGATRSCGCQHVKHQKTGTRLYRIWNGMKSRCSNSTHPGYSHYGGRGITVCDEWKNSSKAFFEWALANGYEDHLTIDRIDVNGNYEPSNCRWVTQRVQCSNKRIKSNTGVVGVGYRKQYGCFRAYICIEGKQYSLGHTKTLQEAIALRRQAESALICNQTI